MVQFQINDTLIELTDDITLLDAKKEIMKQCNVDKPYIDIKYILEKPIRILGKFNVEPGVVPRTLDRYKLERFAVLKEERGKGYGKHILNAILDDLKDYKGLIYIHAQEQVLPFYEKLGFKKEGDLFEEAGIMHYKMSLIR